MRTPRVDWSDWSFGPGRHPIQGAAQAGLAAYSVTMVGAVDGWMPAVWPLVAGAVLACAAAVAAAWQAMPGAVVAYRAVCLVAAGVWSSSTLAWSVPWSRWPLVTLATGTAVAATIGTGLTRMERREQAEVAEKRPMAFHEDPLVRQWRERIVRVANVTVSSLQVERWAGQPCPGFTLTGTMPLGGSTWRALQAVEDGLAGDARLPEGCSVKARPGGNRGAFRLDVMLRNALAEDKHYPQDYPRQSINEPRRIAYLPSDEPVRTMFRQEVAIIVGPTGTGKTNTMDVAIAEHLLCDDVIVCVIDFNAGALALPWLMPWRQMPNQCPNPPISWVADTPVKALEMTALILEVIKDRKQSYAHLKAAQNTKLLPISAQLPQWTIFLDEAAEVLGMEASQNPTVRRVADNLREIQRIGRDAGGRLVISSLGATNETLGSRAIKVNANIKIAMGGTPIEELYYLFDTMKLSAEDANLPGAAHIKLAQGVPMVGKVPLLLPNQQAEIACATSDWRPDPDQRALSILGDRWVKRWDQSRDLLALLDSGGGVDAGLSEPSPLPPMGSAVTLAQPRTEQEETVDSDNLGSSADDLRRKVEAARAAREAAEAEQAEPGPDVAEADWSVVEGWLTESSDDGQKKLPARARMRQLVQEHRRDGIGPRAVYQQLQQEGYGTRESTVITWMRADALAGILAQPGGERTPYVPGPQFRLDQP